MIDTGLFSYLTNHAEVGAAVSDHVYPAILPQDPAYPAITYSQDSLDLDKDFDGQSDFGSAAFQIDAWAETHLLAKQLAKKIRDALMNFSGDMGGINVHRCYLAAGPIDVYESSVDAYRASQTFIFWTNEG